ncbi:ABC transporter ATP-binding protein [Metabacillus malikii]|nr:ABC transporter ATP-binding protein [Metabacillus malikii]
MDYILINGLKKTYKQIEIVKNISFNIRKNEILAIIGPNGAGKTTTLDLILQLKKADEGNIEYWKSKPKESIGVQLQSSCFFPGLTAYENIQLFAALYKKRLEREDISLIFKQYGLEDVMNIDARKLSGGQQKKLSIALALIHEPEVVFLDEPTAALDPRARMEIIQLIKRLQSDGKSIVLTTHDMGEVKQLANRILLLERGEIVASGTIEELFDEWNATTVDELYLNIIKEDNQNAYSL